MKTTLLKLRVRQSYLTSDLYYVKGKINMADRKKQYNNLKVEVKSKKASTALPSSMNVDFLTEPAITEDMKSRAVDEMMERIKKGIILKPILRTPQVGLSLVNYYMFC